MCMAFHYHDNKFIKGPHRLIFIVHVAVWWWRQFFLTVYSNMWRKMCFPIREPTDLHMLSLTLVLPAVWRKNHRLLSIVITSLVPAAIWEKLKYAYLRSCCDKTKFNMWLTTTVLQQSLVCWPHSQWLKCIARSHGEKLKSCCFLFHVAVITNS